MSNSDGRVFDRVLIIMFENMYRSYVMANSYMRSLAEQGIDLANSFGVMHPSQTNYISSIAGELCNVTSDDPPPPGLLQQQTIVDLIEATGDATTWKAYMDSYVPELQPWHQDFQPQDDFPYVIKHDPFSSFATIVHQQARWERIDTEHGFFADVANGKLPNYAWFTPNMWNDGHYVRGTTSEPPTGRAPALVDQLASWLKKFFGVLKFPGPQSLLPKGTLVVVTFDESDFEKKWEQRENFDSTYDGPNQIYTVLLGDMIKPGVQQEGYNHYSLLRTVEKNFALDSLCKNDTDSNWMQFLWGRQFSWDAPSKTPIDSAGALAAAEFGGALHVIYTGTPDLGVRSWDGESWSDEVDLGQSVDGNLALAACGDQLILVYQTPGGLLSCRYSAAAGWSKAVEQRVAGTVGSFDLAAIDGGSGLMLAWSDAEGQLQSLAYSAEKGWASPPVPVGFETDGDVCLGVLGPSVYLIYKSVGNNAMEVISYNTAEFNVVDYTKSTYSGPHDNTTQNCWSPSTFPVAHFSHASYHRLPTKNQPVTQPYAAGAPLVAATLDGVIHLAHPEVDHSQVVEETFSISGVMTPKNPVSYDDSDGINTSNGFGTLAEAGWSVQSPMKGASCEAGGAMAMAKFGSQLILFTQPSAAGEIQMCVGQYSKKNSTVKKSRSSMN